MEVNIDAHASTASSEVDHCLAHHYKRCEDGSCMELCPEDQLMNEQTIMIMTIMGLTVVIFLAFLYCCQQRTQRGQQNDNLGVFDVVSGDGDNLSLNNPPPTYDEVINTNLYEPSTSTVQAATQGSSVEEPRTPPPNYDAALSYVTNTQETVAYSKSKRVSPVVRRSMSCDPRLMWPDSARDRRGPTNLNVR